MQSRLSRCPVDRQFVTISGVMQLPVDNFRNPRKPRREGRAVTVGRTDDVPPGRGATVDLEGGRELALYNVGGQFFATENFCPHRGAPLADGRLCGHIVECDLHGWRFDLRTGQCLTRAGKDIESYEVLIENGWIIIIV